MDSGSRINVHMPLQPRDLPTRRVFNHHLEPDTMYAGMGKSLLAWGATQAKGAPIANHQRPHLSGEALGPNSQGIRAYQVRDEESLSYNGHSNHGWTGVALGQTIAEEPSTWSNAHNNAQGQKLLY